MMKVLVKPVKHLLFVIKSKQFKEKNIFLFFYFFRKSDVKRSTECLTKYLQKVADKEGDTQYARACSALGFIHNTLVKTK